MYTQEIPLLARSYQEAAKAIIQELKNKSSRGQSQPEGTIIYGTDVGADIDDECFLCTSIMLHKMAICNILLVVTNREYEKQRAKTTKRIMNDMGASEIPVASGTDGTRGEKPFHTYESITNEPDEAILDGEIEMLNVLTRLKKKEERCNIVVVSSFRDLSQLIKKHANLVRESVSAFYFQGGWEKHSRHTQFKTLFPDMTITNNQWDLEATLHVHEWLRQECIPTFTATRHSANKAAVNPAALVKAARQGHLVAKYIYNAWSQQERRFFNQAAEEIPEKRFQPRMDLQWYVNRNPRWRVAKGSALPKSFAEMLPYIDITLYDVVAGLPCLLKDLNCFDELFQPHQQTIRVKEKEVNHHIIGRSTEKADINAGLLSELILQLLQEAFASPVEN